MHKLDKYCRRFTDNIITSSRSRYYNMGNHILRVSDHIGNNSSGLFSIIIKDNCYLLHHPNSGSIKMMNYEQVKGFVKIFASFPLGNMMQTTDWKLAKGESILISEPDEISISTNKRKYPLKWFDKGQKGKIIQMINVRLNQVGEP